MLKKTIAFLGTVAAALYIADTIAKHVDNLSSRAVVRKIASSTGDLITRKLSGRI